MATKFSVDRKKTKNLSRDELLQLTKEELVDRIIQLEAHTQQLKNVILKTNTDLAHKSNSKKRPFDFSKCNYRRIFLRVAYLGQNYHGLAVQEDSNDTVEYHLFAALQKSQLLESRDKANYHRCGRTDKGVSASGQVISLIVRSRLTTDDVKSEVTENELPYASILNRILPNDIRVICWMPAPNKSDEEPFSARFDCKYRVYKYWFPKSFLDLNAMNEACNHLIGTHDFRNLCKMDVANGVTSYIRCIYAAKVHLVDEHKIIENSMCCLVIVGNAFLWHQIRCIVAILFIIGDKKEEPEVVEKMLDVGSNPQKPQYNMAVDFPLNLFHCSYEDFHDSNTFSETQPSIAEMEFEKKWIFDKDNLFHVIKCFHEQQMKVSIQSSMINDIVSELTQLCNQFAELNHEDIKKIYSISTLLQGVRQKNYIPLLKRQTCETLENRIQHFVEKKRLKEIQD